MAAIHEATREQDDLDSRSPRDYLPSLADLAETYAGVPGGDPNMLVVEIGETPVGYSRISWWPEDDRMWSFLIRLWLMPRWRSRGIAETMLYWAERRCYGVATEHDLLGKAQLVHFASSTEQWITALLLDRSYVPINKLSEMTLRDLGAVPVVPSPWDSEPRPYSQEQVAEVYWAFKGAWEGLSGGRPASEQDYRRFVQAQLHAHEHDPTLWHMLWAGDRIAGYVFTQVRNEVGILAELAVRKEWHRRGLGRYLTSLAVRALADRGLAEVRLCTDAENKSGAKTLFEHFGFESSKEHALFQKPLIIAT